jgi:hypothetical protein
MVAEGLALSSDRASGHRTGGAGTSVARLTLVTLDCTAIQLPMSVGEVAALIYLLPVLRLPDGSQANSAISAR